MPAIQILVERTELLNRAARDAIIEVCVAAHQEESFRRLFEFAPTGGTHFLAYHDDTLVSHAVVSTRWIVAGNRPKLKTAYVDAVATAPAYQGQGIGSAVMHRLAASLAAYDIGCLETERVAFYARLGWQLWRGPLAGRQDGQHIPMPRQQGIMILQLPHSPPIDPAGPLTIEYDGRFW